MIQQNRGNLSRYRGSFRNDLQSIIERRISPRLRLCLFALESRGLLRFLVPKYVIGGSMHAYSVGTHIFRTLVRFLAVAAIAGSALLQPLSAADSWSKVRKLKEGTRVYVYLSHEETREGSFMGADDFVMNISSANRGTVALDRALVLQVAVDGGGRPWYSWPLTIAAAVAGGAGGYGIAEKTTCVEYGSECRKAKGVVIGGLAGGAAAVTYKLTQGRQGRKVIYVRGR
jgi:hypothetical protein